jgi:rod shape-determining protein MreC
MTGPTQRHLSSRDSWHFLMAFMLSVSLMVIDEQTRLMVQIRMAIATTLQPLQWIARVPENAVVQLSRTFTEHATLLNEMDRLRVQNLLLNQQIQQLLRLDNENSRLKMLLGVSSQIHRGKLLVGIVIDHAPTPYRHILTLNKGSSDGVKEGQAVIDAQGLMGQVLSTTFNQCQVLLITDLAAQTPVRVQRSGVRGIIQGDGNNGLLLKFIATTQDVRVDDLIETSGLDGQYPSGLQVGRARQVTNQSGSLFWHIAVNPVATPMTSHEVLILVQPNAVPSESPAP